MKGNTEDAGPTACLTESSNRSTENSSDQLTPPKEGCDACGWRAYTFVRRIRDRVQWECYGCGAIVEIDAESGGEWT